MIEAEKFGLDDIKEVFRVIFQSILDASGLDSGGIYISDLFNGDMDLYYCSGLSEPFIQAISHIPYDDPRIKLLEEGRSLIINSDLLNTIPSAEVIKAEGIKSIAIFPITYKGGTIGCVNVASHKMGQISVELKDEFQKHLGQLSLVCNRIHAEQRLKESEEKFRTIAEQSIMGISIIQDGVVKYVNNPMSNIVEYSVQDITAWSASELFNIVHPEDRALAMTRTMRHMRGEKFEDPLKTYRFITKSGKVRWVDVYTSNIQYQGRDALMSTFIDSTKRKEAELKLLKYQEHLEELVADRTKQLTALVTELESFSYSVSHDLRAPLRAIDGFSKVILEDYSATLGDQGKEYFYRIRAASQRMSQLIDDILQLSQLSRRKMRIEEVDLSGLSQQILEEFQKREPEREVETNLTPELTVKGDSKLLKLALENLLNNAWKFTSKHAHAIIEFGIQQVNGKPTYFVRDDGAGFDMTFADKLFGPFQRLHTEYEFDGLGIGLATVQRIIHRHEGEIWAEGVVEQGATFYFTINSKILEKNEMLKGEREK